MKKEARKSVQVDFRELRPMINTGHKWRFRQFLKTFWGTFSAYGAASGVATAINALVVAGGVAGGAAATAVMPAVIIPIGIVYILVLIRDQVKKRGEQKQRWNLIFGQYGALEKFKSKLRYIVEKDIKVDGLYDILDNFAGETIEEKLQNIFGKDYEDRYDNVEGKGNKLIKGLKKEKFIRRYKLVDQREKVLEEFFDDFKGKMLDFEHESNFATKIEKEVSRLTSTQYDRLAPKIEEFKKTNPELNLDKPMSSLTVDRTTFERERPDKKSWQFYLEQAAKTILTAFMGAAAGFGLVAGIGVLMGVTAISATGVGLPILIGAVVMAFVIAVLAVAIKVYVDDKANDISDALLDGVTSCNTFSDELDKVQDNAVKPGQEVQVELDSVIERKEQLRSVYSSINAGEVPTIKTQDKEGYPPVDVAVSYYNQNSFFQRCGSSIKNLFSKRGAAPEEEQRPVQQKRMK